MTTECHREDISNNTSIQVHMYAMLNHSSLHKKNLYTLRLIIYIEATIFTYNAAISILHG